LSRKNRWTFNGHKLPSNAFVSGAKVIIEKVKLQNNGSYMCKGLTRSKSKFLSESTLVILRTFKIILHM